MPPQTKLAESRLGKIQTPRASNQHGPLEPTGARRYTPCGHEHHQAYPPSHRQIRPTWRTAKSHCTLVEPQPHPRQKCNPKGRQTSAPCTQHQQPPRQQTQTTQVDNHGPKRQNRPPHQPTPVYLNGKYLENSEKPQHSSETHPPPQWPLRL